jgi:hypothetical protein
VLRAFHYGPDFASSRKIGGEARGAEWVIRRIKHTNTPEIYLQIIGTRLQTGARANEYGIYYPGLVRCEGRSEGVF